MLAPPRPLADLLALSTIPRTDTRERGASRDDGGVPGTNAERARERNKVRGVLDLCCVCHAHGCRRIPRAGPIVVRAFVGVTHGRQPATEKRYNMEI